MLPLFFKESPTDIRRAVTYALSLFFQGRILNARETLASFPDTQLREPENAFYYGMFLQASADSKNAQELEISGGKIEWKDVVFKYNDNEFPVEEINFRDGKLFEKLVYTRDKYNNKTETKFIRNGRPDSIITNVYEYYTKGNWTKRTTFITPLVMYVVERSFEYYN